MQQRQTNNLKRLSFYLPVILLSSIFSGCDLKEEKTYEHYVLHPDELRHDYNYCEKHPSAGVCVNIVKKYFSYRERVKPGTGIFQFNNPDAPQMSTGYIFRNIDEPLNTFGSNG